MQSPRSRSLSVALAAALAVGACGELPTTPDRTAFPGKGDELPAPKRSGAEEPAGPVVTDSIDAELFAPVRDALARGDWIAARLALPAETAPEDAGPAGDPAPTSTTALWVAYYQARIALLRGRLRDHETALSDLESETLPESLEAEIVEHRLTLAELRGDARAQLRLARRLQTQGGHPRRSPEALRDTVWVAAQRLVLTGEADGVTDPDPETRAWLDLATSTQGNRTALDTLESLDAWRETWPEHDGQGLAEALSKGARADALAERYTLLLPLSGPLGAAGDAVARGSFAAFYAERAPRIALDVLDSRRYADIGVALDAAARRGPAVVMGPLAKRPVEELLGAAPAGQPVLALNRPETQAAADTVLQLALAPEDEATQLAELAFADGVRRVLLLRPEGVWGERIGSALGTRWSELGGTLVAEARYDRSAAYSDVIRSALALDASSERARELRSLFSEGIETSGRRRQDIDGVFLLTRASQEARALKPLLNYHYAGDLPTYALSTADAGNLDANRDRDLDDLRLLVMPWRLQRGGVPGLGREAGSGSFDALHALGVDAYHIARHWSRVHSTALPIVAGLTAELRADDDGVLRRRLRAAEFDGGQLRPR